jgi:hypothetical protein
MTSSFAKWLIVATAFAALGFFGMEARADEKAPKDNAQQTIQGRVVFLGEALKRLHGIETPVEGKENVLALESFDGRLTPLVEDVRGRAFRKDERLREIDVELLVREVPKSSIAQVIGVRKLDRKAGKKFDVDYWCDICAIAMYELKQCECCQGEIELRLRESTGE